MRHLLAGLLFVASGAALATAPEPVVSSLAERVVHPHGEAIGVAPRDVTTFAADDVFRAGWSRFRTAHRGNWTAYFDERSGMPALVRGPGIRWFEADSTLTADPSALEAVVRRFLAEQRDWIGDWSDGIEIDRQASRRLRPGHEQIVLRQVADGVRVDNARFDFHIIGGKLVMFGATYWAPVGRSGLPTLSLDEAQERLQVHVGADFATLRAAVNPELVLLAVDATPSSLEPSAWEGPRGRGIDHVLVWRFRLLEPVGAPLWVGEVDAHDGSIHAFYDDTEWATTEGGVFPFSNDGDCADGGCEIARLPMPYSNAIEDSQATVATDGSGQLECVDSGAGYTAELSGPYVHINDLCGTFEAHATCSEGIDLGTKSGENCAVDPLQSAGNTAAARTSYYHINRAAEAARFYDPVNTWLQSVLTVNVNDPSSCNAFWNGEITMRREGNGCGNMGEIRGILFHEWGHGHDHNDGGGSDSPSEAYADVMALFSGRDSCIARGWFSDGSTCDGHGDTCLSCTGIRDVDWAARVDQTPATHLGFVASYCPPSFGGSPCNRQNHCEGHVVSETIFDLATRDLPAAGIDPDSAWQITERLWYVSRQGSGGNMYLCIWPNIYSCNATTLHLRMLAADDDDGDLSNGTPHAAEIFAAFDRHGLACGNSGDAENQSSSSCPTIGTPLLSTQELPGGTELSWTGAANAAEYRVYGNELGCDLQQTALVDVAAPQTNYLDPGTDPQLPRYYRVEPIGSNPACFGAVSNCVETFGGARLQYGSYGLVESGTANGIPDPGETVQMPIALFNSGTAPALATQGTLTFVDPAQGTVLESQTGWSGPDPSASAVSQAPHFEIEIGDNVGCGDLVAFELEVSASNAQSQTSQFGIQLGDKERDLLQDQDLVVPSAPAGSFSSTLDFDQDLTIAHLDVSIDVDQNEEHDLIVEFISPEGTIVRLHDQSTVGFGISETYDLTRVPDGPGSMDDFLGESTLGTWTVTVEDVGTDSISDTTLDDWTLHLTVEEGFDCLPASCSEPTPSVVPMLSVGRIFDGVTYDLEFAWTAVAGVAGYHVLQSSAADFGSDVTLVGEPGPGATSFVIDEPLTPDLVFFQVRGVNSCGLEGP